MREGHIYIYGIISAQVNKKYGNVGLKDVVEQMHMNKDAEVLKVHIRSEGGDVEEGYMIHDALVKSGKIIETIGEGIVASIATVIFLAGSKRTMTANAEFMIHNPWAKGEGTASELEENAKSLREIENTLATFYTQKTGVAIDLIKELMSKETTLTSDQAKNYGFATESQTTLKAVALLNNNLNDLKMTKDELNQEMDKKFESFFSKVKNLFSKPKNSTVTAGDGSVLDFGDQIQDPSEIAVGMTAKLEDGSPANGDYVMPDGSTLTFEAGNLTVIIPVEAANPEMEALKTENESLKQEVEALKAQNLSTQKDNDKKFEALNKEIITFKAQIKSDVEGFSKKNNEKDEPENNRFAKVFNK